MRISKTLQITVSIIGLLAALVYMLYFFNLVSHPYIPAICGGLLIASYLFGIYAKKQNNK